MGTLDIVGKIQCKECGWVGNSSELLTGKNPFEDSDVEGCPQCKSIACFAPICDEPGCQSRATWFRPIKDGGRQTCKKHFASGEVR